ncbi:MAG TPA: cation:proton antiporter [Candidatus Thermoplasmatota archaeon]|nr:cation:proton antiporter [Candidatus Thermoplasmatota archaeon]
MAPEGTGKILLDLAVIFLGAKLGGEAAVRLRQPAVLGELLVGILLSAGILGGLAGLPDLAVPAGPRSGEVTILQALATLGAILLLFQVGLESRVSEMRKVGVSSLLVAAIGLLVSFALGYAASWGLAAAWAPWHAANAAIPAGLLHVFVGATLTATSVGITARVLADLGRLKSPEARIVLGAAVLDDVGGLLVLAAVTALIAAATGGAPADAAGILRIAAIAIGFLVASLLLGLWLAPRAFDWLAGRLKVPGSPLAIGVAFALAMAYAASLAGLADIVGAFTAGLLLAGARRAHGLFEQLRPLASLLVGVFFVTLGMHVEVAELARNAVPVLVIGSLLAVVAVAAKLTCGWGVVRGQADRFVVGVGMVPRGEVGLIFASLGLSAGLLANWQYALLLYVVLVTTFVTPLWLGRLQGRFTGVASRVPESGTDMAEIAEG